MPVVLELDLACCPEPNRALAGVVISQELVGCSIVAGLVLSVVVVPGQNQLVAKRYGSPIPKHVVDFCVTGLAETHQVATRMRTPL